MENSQRKRSATAGNGEESNDSFDDPYEIVKRAKFDIKSSPLKGIQLNSADGGGAEKNGDSNGHDSRDSFDSFDDSVNFIRKDADSDMSRDSFDEPVDLAKKRTSSPTSNPLFALKRPPAHKLKHDSGVDGFPSLNNVDDQMVLIVETVEKGDFYQMLRCSKEMHTEVVVFLELQGQWSSLHAEQGTKLRIIGPKVLSYNHFLISDDEGLVILHPDTLVQCTATTASSWCTRKVILNDEFKVGVAANKAMLIGCVIHELFQLATSAPNPSTITHDWLLTEWRHSLTPSVMESLVALSFTPRGFETELQPYADVIVNWIKSRIPETGSRKLSLPSGSSIIDVHDIEENIWEPILGLKGKIDASLKVETDRGSIMVEPLELKTGKSGHSFEHAGQVLLYLLMLSIRYKQPLGQGSLLYLKDGTERLVKPKIAELKGVIHSRNRVAEYLNKVLNEDTLPEPKSDPHFCGKCDHALTCSLSYMTSKSKENCEYTEKFVQFASSMTNHLYPDDIEYFARWVKWLRRERVADRKSKNGVLSDIWNVDPEEREARGRCASYMKLIRDRDSKDKMLTFERSNTVPEGVFLPGSMCVVSSSQIPGILLVFIAKSTEYSITVRCDSPSKILEVASVYHIDVYDSFSNYSSLMGNVASLMYSEDVSVNLRDIIIRQKEPSFNNEFEVPDGVRRILLSSSLNKGQYEAVMKALKSLDYSLIEGLPGAGKTTSIAVLVRCLVAAGCSVLLCSYTNSAVDNVLAKLLKDMNPSLLLRLGRVTRGRDELLPLTLEEILTTIQDPQKRYDITRKVLKETPVVACTCHHTARDVLFSWRKFDVCVVDEASMVLEPVILSALVASKRFVMVGDSKQLSPLVIDRQSRTEGMSSSLFERLQVNGASVTSLVEQFRMNSRIAQVASSLFYDGRLVCANNKVAIETLDLKESLSPDLDEYLRVSMSKELDHSALFLDTKSLNNRRFAAEKSNGGVINKGECDLVVQIVKLYCEKEVNASDIGVMCVYRKQVDLIRSLLSDDVEVNTIDQYQGRDKRIIILSIGWTSALERECELLKDAGRVNVAVTRAKHKLIVIGCRQSLDKIQLMRQLINNLMVVSV